MMRGRRRPMRFELKEGSSSKFWSIELDGKSFTATWGRIGTAGQSKKQTFKSTAEAKTAHDKLINEKRKKGYSEIKSKSDSAPAAPPIPRNESLEETLREDLDLDAPFLVYADWLQAHDSPLGELITLQHAMASSGDKKLKARAKKIIDGFQLPSEDLVKITWRWGFFDALRLENQADWMNNDFDALSLSRRLFTTPMCAALRELRLGVLRWESNHEDVPALIDEAARQPWAASLRRLHLGDVEDVDMAHHVIGDVGKKITRAFPALEWLKLHSGSQSWHGRAETFGVSGLALPHLRELYVETCAMTKKRLKDLFAAKLPSLTTLELWFGANDYDCNVKTKDLEPLLKGDLFPEMTHLGLRNTELADDLARLLPKSPLAPRLLALDLSLGTLTDDGARALSEHAGAFSRLKKLDVHRSYLSKAAIAALKRAFSCDVIAKDQKDDEVEEDGTAYRYVSVHE
jgi:uncharacterized protein (TIGR02996 family)